MARPIVLSNGELHVGINTYGLVHDFYYPYVGLENHTIGKGLRHRIGVWIDGFFTWLDDGSWHIEFRYHDSSLIGHTIAKHTALSVMLEFDDCVDSDNNIFIRNIHVVNQSSETRTIRLFLHQAFVIGDSRSNTDTVQYLPDSQAMLHYRGRRVFIISAESGGESFDQYSAGLFGIEGREGTWRDAEDGELSMSASEHGRVDSTLRFSLTIEKFSSTRVHYWIVAAPSLREALSANHQLRQDGVAQRLHDTATWWQDWLKPAYPIADRLSRDQRRLFLVSTMILKSHIDKRGAIIASTDSGMLNYGRDAYAYTWPRDGAYVLWPLIRMGYTDEARAFFDFCRRGLHPRGYLSHKYRADGAIGSSWHTYLHADSSVGAPIQIDETAGVLFMFAQFYDAHPEPTLLSEYYKSLVIPMAQFLVSSIDTSIHLPRPSYDLWEEVYMSTTYTTAVVFGALRSAAELADAMSDEAHAVAWRSAAEDIKEAAQKLLYNEERQSFVKGLRRVGDSYEPDTTIDSSSIYGAFMYGLFAMDSPELKAAVATWTTRFKQAEGTGLPRYEGDSYHRDGDAESNFWHITTLWYAQYCLEIGDRETADKILAWVEQHAMQSGVLAEQIVPHTDKQTSVAPLAWSHAEYLATILDMLNERE